MLYILLPVFNRKKITVTFVNQLLLQSFTSFKLILIDDGSNDGTADAVKGMLGEKVIILYGSDMWWGGSLDLGYNWLRVNAQDADRICIINDDVQIDKFYLENCIQELETLRENTLLFTPSYSIQTNKMLETGVYYNFLTYRFDCVEDPERVNCLSTRGLFFSFPTFKKIGGFYPKLLPHYLSDYEFTIRAGLKGCDLVVSRKQTLKVDEDTTGIHNIYELSSVNFIRYFFSKRCSRNPIYLFMFPILINPGLKLKVRGAIISLFRSSMLFVNYFLVKFKIRTLTQRP